MKHVLLLFATMITTLSNATVIITHGLGTTGIAFYQDSSYTKKISDVAQQLGHTTKCITWISQSDLNKEYAGLLPQERIAGAINIAKAIIDEQVQKNSVILIGHSYGGHVLSCATRLLNANNQELTDSFIGELIYTIKQLLNQPSTKGISPAKLLNTIFTGWQLSQVIINAIEKSNIVNKNIIEFVKQHLSLTYLDEIKKAWKLAFAEVQMYKLLKGITTINNISTIYTIGTTYHGDAIFSPDMTIAAHHVNLYSPEDIVPFLVGSFVAPKNNNTTNLRVYFEPRKAYAPKHNNFCGNTIMAPWILLVPEILQTKKLGNFENFKWGSNGSITFYANQPPLYQA